MTTSFATAFALACLGMFRAFHAGRANGFIWLLAGLVVVCLVALIFRCVSKRPSA
jgi:predicted cobalt transporter CbtA